MHSQIWCMIMTNTLLVVDGNNICHRARHKYDLDNRGTDVSITYGFMHMLFSYMRKFKPNSVVVCWDGGVPQYRRDKLPIYKANRVHIKDGDELEWENFLHQMHEIRDISLPLMGVLSVWRHEIEADDLMYQMVRLSAHAYDKIVVCSGDKDLWQCCKLGDHVIVYTSSNVEITRTDVENHSGCPITEYVTWRALQGDSSDNIPGVKGIGPVRATALLQEYRHLSGVYNAAMDGKLGAIGSNIISFGFNALVNNVYIMTLAFDRTGSRKVLLDGTYTWNSYDGVGFKHYLMRNAFISFMDPAIYSQLSKLECPIIDDSYRIPIISPRRYAI